MKILFLSHYFPPEVNAPANRTFEHTRCWVRDGHDVTVITGVPNHPRGRLFPGYANRWIQEETVDGIRVIRTWMYLTSNEGFLRRTLNYVLFAATAVLASFRISRADRPDLVVATSPQFFCGIAGAVVARLKRRPFVLEVRDLWPDSIVQLGQLESRLAIRMLEGIESLLYRSAAGIVVNTRAFIEHIVARGIPRNRIELVYNGIDPALFTPREADAELMAAHGLAGKTIVAYIGTLGLAHGLRTIIDAAEALREEPETVFALIGDGADREALEAEVARRRLENVRFLGLRPREEIPGWIASSAVLLVMLRDLPVFRTVIPSKLFEFWAQERPVLLAAPAGECRSLLEDANAGFTIEPEDVQALVDAIATIRSHPEEAARRARLGRELVEREFLRDALARRMARFFETVLARR